MGFGTRGVVVCKSQDVELVQDACGVFTAGRTENGGVGRRMGYIYLYSCDYLVQLGLLVYKHKMGQPSSSTTTRHRMNDKPRDEIENLRRGISTPPGSAFASHTLFAAQTSCISEHTE